MVPDTIYELMVQAMTQGILESSGKDRWDAMRVLADWLEDNNQPDLAYAYRWAAKRKAFPWLVKLTGKFSWIDVRLGKKRTRNHQLPRGLFANIAGNRWEIGGSTVHEAFEILAKAIRTVRDEIAL